MSTEAVMEGRHFYQLSIAVNPGNSGGPTIDSSGKVFGVVTLKSTRMEATAFCIPAADLLSAIARAASRPGDKPALLAMHRARSIAIFLDRLGEFYASALSRAVTGMDTAITQCLDPNLAFGLVQREVNGGLQTDEAILKEFSHEFNRVYTDARIADSIRRGRRGRQTG